VIKKTKHNLKKLPLQQISYITSQNTARQPAFLARYFGQRASLANAVSRPISSAGHPIPVRSSHDFFSWSSHSRAESSTFSPRRCFGLPHSSLSASARSRVTRRSATSIAPPIAGCRAAGSPWRTPAVVHPWEVGCLCQSWQRQVEELEFPVGCSSSRFLSS
jgi:hypothetical protein